MNRDLFRIDPSSYISPCYSLLVLIAFYGKIMVPANVANFWLRTSNNSLSIGNWSYSIKSMVFLLTLNFFEIIEIFNKIPFDFFSIPYWTNIWVFQLIFGSCKKGKYNENLIGFWIENLIEFAGVLKTIYAMSAGWHVICRYLENISHECWWMVLQLFSNLSAQAIAPPSKLAIATCWQLCLEEQATPC